MRPFFFEKKNKNNSTLIQVSARLFFVSKKEMEGSKIRFEKLDDVALDFTAVYQPMENLTFEEYKQFLGKKEKLPKFGDEEFVNRLKQLDQNSPIIKRMQAIYKSNGILDALFDIIGQRLMDWDEEDEEEKNHYIAYSFADDAQEYIDIALDFDIIQHKGRKKKTGPYVELSIGYLARFMSGQKWCVIKGDDDQCHIMYANDFLKEVLKWSKREHGATVVTFHPVTQESVNMWKRLARQGELDEPFASLVPQRGDAAFRQTAGMDLFNLELRICSVCDWFAHYTYDHPQLGGKLFFCGQRCSEVKWQSLKKGF
jgi:hypothetical protein